MVTLFSPVLAVVVGLGASSAERPQILHPGSYVISAGVGIHTNSARVGWNGERPVTVARPNDPAPSFLCPASNNATYSNLCAEMVVGISSGLNCFFNDTVVPVATHDGSYFGVAGMQVVAWPYDNVASAPVRLWYVYWLNVFNQPLTGYGRDQKLYAIATCV
ncbi:MAG TPA: hypothetical protein VMF61_15675 [Candidatus Acidoferrales bacterium]|nr:hypothetical protein [Candidatus Acidoferrales bacterium]